MSQPFYQPARQNFSSSQSMQQPQGGFGGFGGGQMPQQNWGGGQGFSGFGGGQGFNFGGGQAFGGFQQQQFNPFQGGFGGGFSPFQGGFGGGFGGGFQPQGFGGGFNPMFGGIGGLGFNPMMGQGFGMPMQGFNPYQQHVQLQQPQDFGTFDMMYRGGPQMSPEMQQRREQDMRNMERIAQQPAANTSQDAFIKSPEYKEWQKQAQFTSGVPYDAAYKNWQKSQPVQSTPQQPNVGVQAPMDAGGMPPSEQDMAQRQAQLQAMYGYSANMARQPMYGGIGGLGFNPMMGPQFGMPMQGFAPYQERASARDPYRQQFQPQQDVARRQDQMPRIADPTSPLSETDWAARNAARAASGREFRPETYDAYLKGFKTPEQMQAAIRQRQTLTM